MSGVRRPFRVRKPSKVHIKGVGPGPGEMRGDLRTVLEAATEESSWVKSSKSIDSFLFPQMPGAFQPSDIRKKPLEWLKERYLQVLSASMGIHSVALFYCDWSQEQFEAILDKAFIKQIEWERSKLADRATYIMYKGMGLVGDGVSNLQPSITAAMAKVVEGLREQRNEQSQAGARHTLVVEGLDRNQAGLPPSTEAERIP